MFYSRGTNSKLNIFQERAFRFVYDDYMSFFDHLLKKINLLQFISIIYCQYNILYRLFASNYIKFIITCLKQYLANCLQNKQNWLTDWLTGWELSWNFLYMSKIKANAQNQWWDIELFDIPAHWPHWPKIWQLICNSDGNIFPCLKPKQ